MAAETGRLQRVLWTGGLSLFGLAFWLAAWNVDRPRAYPDTFDYTSLALEYTGVDRISADRTALRFASRYAQPGSIAAAFSYNPGFEQGGFEAPRYRGIFQERPLYPAVSASLMPVLGLNAMIVAAALGGILFAVALGLTVEMLTASKLLSLLAVALAYALPLGLWLVALIAEGWMLALWTASLGLAMAYERTRRPKWLAAFILATILLTLTKSTNAAALAFTVATVAVVSLVWRRGSAPALWRLTGVAVGVVAAFSLASAALGLPNLTDATQDLLTDHYRLPDVPSPWAELARLSAYRMPRILHDASLALWVILLPAAARLLAARWAWSGLWLTGAVASFLLFAGHPEPSEGPRYLAPIWVSAVVGLILWPLALGIDRWIGRGRSGALPIGSAAQRQLEPPRAQRPS